MKITAVRKVARRIAVVVVGINLGKVVGRSSLGDLDFFSVLEYVMLRKEIERRMCQGLVTKIGLHERKLTNSTGF